MSAGSAEGRRSTRDLSTTLRGAGETSRLVRGGHWYVADHIGPQHAWMRVVRSDIAHGRIAGIDTSEALATDGVIDVFTAESLGAEIPLIPLRSPNPVTQRYVQPVIASDHVRYVGEPVAVVVAESAYTAEDAAEVVFVEIDPLENVPDVTTDRAGIEDRDDGVLAAAHAHSGDADRVFAEAEFVVRETFHLPRMTGMPMETRGLIAEWRTEDGDERLHLWGPTKYIFFARNTVAAMLGIDPEAVVIHGVDVGGMFGVRGDFYPEDFLVPWAARVVGRPIAWVEDRREHMLSINHSREQTNELEVAVSAEGDLLGMRARVLIDAGAYARPTGARQVLLMCDSLPGPYRWQALDMTVESVTTNKTPAGNMRGPLGFEATFARERAVDEAAARLGIDPLELRRRNLVGPDQMPYRTELDGSHPETIIYDSGDFVAGFDAVVESFGVEQAREELVARRAAGETVGLGIAAFVEHSGPGRSETVLTSLDHDGVLTLSTGTVDIGQGLSNLMVQIAHEQLGIAAESVRTVTGDSRIAVDSGGTYGSRTAIFVGNALADALARVREEAVGRAAERLGVRPDEITVQPDGLAAGGDLLHWKEVAPIDEVGRHDMDRLTYGFGAHIAVVTVDPETLDVRVERLLAAYDCGRAIDPVAVRGQLVGGAVAGLANTLFEEIRYSDDGQPMTTTLMEYLLPSCAEVPPVEALILEMEPAPGNPLGIKGVAEAGVLGVGAAIANAVTDALGDRLRSPITRLPLRPDLLHSLVEGTAPGGER